MNKLYRQDLINKLDKAFKDSELVSPKLEHSYLTGKHREILLLKQLIKPLLASRYDTGSGKITDHLGNFSTEIDVLVYSTSLLSPQIFQENFGVYPSESVLSCIEVKSSINDGSLKEVVEKFQKNKGDIKYLSGEFDELDRSTKHSVYDFTRELFVFKSDKNINNLFDKYKEIDKNWDSNDTALNNICVVGKGWWGYCGNRWQHQEATNDYEEVIRYLATLLNTLEKVTKSRKSPRIDQYLTDVKTEELTGN
jgi:hypothetical protein